MKRLLALALSLLPSLAWAQNAVLQGGAIIRFDLPGWVQDRTISTGSKIFTDNFRGFNPFHVYDQGGNAVCAENRLTNGPYSQLCFGHDANGNGTIALNSFTGEPLHTLNVSVNGSLFQFPPPGVAGSTPAYGTTPITLASCVGDGIANDTACFQSAVNTTAAAGVPLILDGVHKYLISSTITSTGTPIILGTQGGTSIYSSSCPSGIVVRSDITAFDFTGPSGRVENVCFEMGSAAGQRNSGAAVHIGATSSTQQGHFQLKNNTVIHPYDGFLIGGTTTGTTQTTNTIVADNLIINPKHIGITNGLTSTNASTNSTTIRDNAIVCFAFAGSATGIAIYDGSVEYYGGDGGPYGCNIGTALIPQSGQVVIGSYTGIFGDSNITNSLLVSPAAGGAVNMPRIHGAWAGYTVSGTTNTNILFSGAGSIKDVIVDGLLAHSGPLQTTPIIDIQTGGNISITGSHILADGSGTATGPGIRIGTNPTNVVINGNIIGSGGATLTSGVQLNAAGGGTIISNNGFSSTTGVTVTGASNVFSLLGNNLALTTTPISYTPNGETAILRNNIGVDGVQPTLASASTITLPLNPQITLSGTAAIATINGGWSGRDVMFFQTGPVTFVTGGTAGKAICNALSPAAGLPVLAHFSPDDGCWHLK